MGTNYYHRTNCCDKCNRYNERHIGKSSCGWTFGFKGYIPYDNTELTIKSYKDWVKVLASEGKIFDEYRDEISLADFMSMVEKKKKEMNNHVLYCRRERLDTYYPHQYWLDEEGHSFVSHEFS